jgi:hypothetical protein
MWFDIDMGSRATNTIKTRGRGIMLIEASRESWGLHRKTEEVLVGVNPPIENNIESPLKALNGSVLWSHEFYLQLKIISRLAVADYLLRKT